jgi:hypothetical protein
MPGGVTHVGIVFSLYLRDILTHSHHVELVLAKPSQSANRGAECCAKRKSPPRLLAIPAFYGIAGL